MNNDYNNQQPPQAPEAGKSIAAAALVCSILSLVIGLFGGLISWWVPYIGLALAIAGIVLAAAAKKQGFTGGMQVGALVMAILGLVFSLIFAISCTACYCACKSAENAITGGYNDIQDAINDALNDALNNN